MKNKLLTMILTLSFLSAGDLGGYSIFEYNNRAFEMNRVYLQYTDDLSDDLFLKIRYDVGREGANKDGKFSSYLKNAYVDWDIQEYGKLSLGLIGTNSYSVQETNWGYRFIAKSAPDMYGFTNTADLGIGISKSIGNIELSIQALNGEGYKNKDQDKSSSTYFRALYGEKKLNKNDGFNLGLVYNNNSNTNETLFGAFGAYAAKHLGSHYRVGIEYNIYENTSITEKVTSLYSDVNFNKYKNTNVFFRLDSHSTHSIEDVPNLEDVTMYFGCVINPVKGLYISPHLVNNDNTDYKITFMFKY